MLFIKILKFFYERRERDRKYYKKEEPTTLESLHLIRRNGALAWAYHIQQEKDVTHKNKVHEEDTEKKERKKQKKTWKSCMHSLNAN